MTTSAATEPAAPTDDRLDGPVHEWFELSYSNYLVLPRTLLQSMPVEWQQDFVACLEELDIAFAHVMRADAYKVTAGYETYGGPDGEPAFHALSSGDPVPHYDRGRTFIQPAEPIRTAQP